MRDLHRSGPNRMRVCVVKGEADTHTFLGVAVVCHCFSVVSSSFGARPLSFLFFSGVTSNNKGIGFDDLHPNHHICNQILLRSTGFTHRMAKVPLNSLAVFVAVCVFVATAASVPHVKPKENVKIGVQQLPGLAGIAFPDVYIPQLDDNVGTVASASRPDPVRRLADSFTRNLQQTGAIEVVDGIARVVSSLFSGVWWVGFIARISAVLGEVLCWTLCISSLFSLVLLPVSTRIFARRTQRSLQQGVRTLWRHHRHGNCMTSAAHCRV
jgi:hypothetical protein